MKYSYAVVEVVSLENKVSDGQVTRVLITNQEFHKLQI
jgi:predicted thioesterase